MSQDKRNRVCPVELADGLDSKIRKLLQNPQKILKPYLETGMTVLDIGCGPGVFSIEMAKMVGASGRVIAADLQEGMLEILEGKVKGTYLEKIIELHKCEAERIGVSGNVDFILAFYMVHEVPDRADFFKEVYATLKPGGKALIVEPKIHVFKKEFEAMVKSLLDLGFGIVDRPKIFFSRSVLLKSAN
jgi:ubiquinone/menaquinone biosynthesis C-methylase UbiE